MKFPGKSTERPLSKTQKARSIIPAGMIFASHYLHFLPLIIFSDTRPSFFQPGSRKTKTHKHPKPPKAGPWCVSPSVCQTQWAAAWPSQWCPWPRPTRSTPTSALTPCPPCQGPTWPGLKVNPGGTRGEMWTARRTRKPPWRTEDRHSKTGWAWRMN